jgi:hypothetical protein
MFRRNLPQPTAFALKAQKGPRWNVRGISRRFGSLGLRDLFPFSPSRPASKRRRRWFQARQRAETFSPTEYHPLDRQVLERHVLDYRMLDSVRLGFGEIHADN